MSLPLLICIMMILMHITSVTFYQGRQSGPTRPSQALKMWVGLVCLAYKCGLIFMTCPACGLARGLAERSIFFFNIEEEWRQQRCATVERQQRATVTGEATWSCKWSEWQCCKEECVVCCVLFLKQVTALCFE